MTFCFSASCCHGGADGASRAAAEELHAVLEDQVLRLAGCHIRFQFRINGNNFHFLAEQSAAFVDHLYGIDHAVEIAFADILEGSRKRLRHPEFNGVLSRAQTGSATIKTIRKMNKPPIHFFLISYLPFSVVHCVLILPDNSFAPLPLPTVLPYLLQKRFAPCS